MDVSERTMLWLRENWLAARRWLHDRFNWTLPFGDCVVARWEKARELGFGEGTSIYDSSVVIGDVTAGRHTWIGPFTMLDVSGGLTIGDHCSISVGVQSYTHDSVQWAMSSGAAQPERAPAVIGSRCHIGPNVTVSRGVTIDDGCVIGANSLVRTSIPAGSRTHGTPCLVVGAVGGPAGGDAA